MKQDVKATPKTQTLRIKLLFDNTNIDDWLFILFLQRYKIGIAKMLQAIAGELNLIYT